MIGVLQQLSNTVEQIALPRGRSRERARDVSVGSHRSRVEDKTRVGDRYRDADRVRVENHGGLVDRADIHTGTHDRP